MKLYYSPGACSLSPHIVAREAGIAIDLQKVDLKTKQVAGGSDFLQINARGYVPVLELDNGERLSEGPAIVQYLADQKPDSGLAPKAGTMERYRLQEALNFTTSELHKTWGAFFNPNSCMCTRPPTPASSPTLTRWRMCRRSRNALAGGLNCRRWRPSSRRRAFGGNDPAIGADSACFVAVR